MLSSMLALVLTCSSKVVAKSEGSVWPVPRLRWLRAHRVG